MDSYDPIELSCPDDSNGGASGSPAEQSALWTVGTEVLGKLLREGEGCVSSAALRRELKGKGVEDPRDAIYLLRMNDADADRDEILPEPSFRFFHHGRSFYSEAAFLQRQKQTEREAEAAERKEEASSSGQKGRRSEEARLVTYVKAALEQIYYSDYGPDDREYVFDVHNDRAGGDFENVDVLAAYWRSPGHVDLVSVEVKLEFNARLIQQACNYTRFSHRVWIAVPVRSQPSDAAAELLQINPRLFDYVIDRGIGILACRRCQGRSYDVFPVHWPRRMDVEPLERDEFVERHRSCFECAEVVPREGWRAFPVL